MKHVLIDLDGIVADLLSHLIEVHNTEQDDTLSVDKITTWEIAHHCREGTGGKMFQLFAREGLYRGLRPIPGAIRAVTDLNRFCDVHIVTAAMHPCNLGEKLEWVHEHFPFIRKRQVIFAHDKHLIAADVLIDDKPETAKLMKRAQPGCFVASIEYPYNAGDASFDLLAKDYRKPETAWEEICAAILETKG